MSTVKELQHPARVLFSSLTMVRNQTIIGSTMETGIRDKLHRINCLGNEMEALYHQAALKLGVSDSVLCVLYMLYDKQGSCLLQDICRDSWLTKQTVHSAIRKLEEENLVYLKQHTGKTKRVHLTAAGMALCQNTVAKLMEAECAAFSRWTEEEVAEHLRLMEKYNDCFRKQIENL